MVLVLWWTRLRLCQRIVPGIHQRPVLLCMGIYCNKFSKGRWEVEIEIENQQLTVPMHPPSAIN